MQIETRFGTQDISPEDVITFADGIPGFNNSGRFKLFHETENPNVFMLQSLDDPELSFSVTDPARLRVQYELSLSDEEAKKLSMEQGDNIAVLVMLYESRAWPFADETAPASVEANLLGPIVINTDKRTGMQKVLNDVEQFVTIRAG